MDYDTLHARIQNIKRVLRTHARGLIVYGRLVYELERIESAAPYAAPEVQGYLWKKVLAVLDRMLVTQQDEPWFQIDLVQALRSCSDQSRHFELKSY